MLSLDVADGCAKSVDRYLIRGCLATLLTLLAVLNDFAIEQYHFRMGYTIY